MQPIGIIGAMTDEVKGLVARLDGHEKVTYLGIEFHTGTIFSKPVVIARCGIGKVFAAMCASAMIMKFSPRLIVNTGVGGALSGTLSCGDIVVGERLVQHDMDTSAIGDPVGLVSGINKIFFDADERAVKILMGLSHGSYSICRGVIASGDRFVADTQTKQRIATVFGATVCEMEGAAIAQVAYVSGTPFVVVRAISDGANDDARLDYPTFLALAAKNSQGLTLSLIEQY